MKAGIYITARVESSRLRQKHLQKVNGKAIMNYLIQRINTEFQCEIDSGDVLVIIVTGDKESNQPLEKAMKGAEIFYGDPDNIPRRHVQAAKYFELDLIVSVDGDDTLCSPKAIRAVYEKLLTGARYVNSDGLPLGLNACGYTFSFLEECVNNADVSLLETGWGRIFNKDELVTIHFESKDEKYLRFTLDYQEDLDFFKKIITHQGIDINTISDEELIDLVLNEKIYEINAPVAEEYWDNFYKARAAEEEKGQLEQEGQEIDKQDDQ